MSRSLLLKGLAGVAALGGTVGGLAVYGKEIFGGWGKAPEEPKSEDVSNFSQKELIDKVGLNCQIGESETELTDGTTKECSVKEGSTLRIMVGQQEEEGVTFTTNGSKLKVSKSEEKGTDGTDKYNKKLKFVVDSGDISLTKTGGSSSIQKLEQFETYEVFLRDKKFYLRRKTDAKEEKIKALGLPSGKGKCSLPETGDSNCTLTIEEAKKINFENQTGGVTVSTGTVTLKISKMSDSTDFTDGYRFTFTFPGDVTINSKQLKANIPYDFKIKKGTGNTLSLEKAWSDDKDFTKKAGLKCETNNECTVPADSQNLNVKVGNQKKEGISSISNGKIKMETEQAGYNQGLKFTITTADISISSVTGEIQKLEELETYEITEEGGKYYLTRKTSKEESIRSSLSIPESCFTALGTSCTLSADAFKAINFKDKSSPSATGEVKLKISKTSSTDFPLGYRFTFNTTTEATIKNSEIKIKANIPTDFKIKKEEGKSISLEKAWSETKFAEKVGLTCTSESDGCCNKSDASGQLNIKKGTETKTGITSFGASDSGKIKVEKDQAGYNQGLKFTISGGNVSLTGGSGATFSNLEELETYEITEEGDKYYLTRKTEASATIETQLGLPSSCKLASASPCSLTAQDLQKINFNDKDTGSPSTGNATLTIAKATNTTDFPLGYKFTLQSTSGDITIKSTTNVVKQNISTDFKIKKPTSTGSLSLEKAWTAESLGKKVGLSCTGETECTIDSTSGSNLRVKQLNGHDNEVKQTSLTKKNNSSGTAGKIKVTKDQAGYNQGFKFKIEDGSIDLNGSSGDDDGSKVHRLGEFETYEIKEENGEWYLERKERADDFIKKQLQLVEAGCSESEKFPHGPTGNTTCSIKEVEKLKKINFEGKENHNNNWPKGSISVELEIKHDSSLPGGFKFTFSDSSSDVCLPTGTNGGKFNLQKSSSSGVDYKIKKTGSGANLKLSLEKKDNGGSNNCTTGK